MHIHRIIQRAKQSNIAIVAIAINRKFLISLLKNELSESEANDPLIE